MIRYVAEKEVDLNPPSPPKKSNSLDRSVQLPRHSV